MEKAFVSVLYPHKSWKRCVSVCYIPAENRVHSGFGHHGSETASGLVLSDKGQCCGNENMNSGALFIITVLKDG